MPQVSVANKSITSQLELNFLQNFYSHCGGFHGDVHVALADKIKEAQVYLHRLGYLSHAIQVNGVYTDFVLEAVKRFQVVANISFSVYVCIPMYIYYH